MSNRISERIEAVELSSEANLYAREQVAETTRLFRWLCVEHVRIFGIDLAMWLLWQIPLPQRDWRVKLPRRRTLYAKTLDNVTIGRAFYPAKCPGYCYICKRDCLTVDCAITRWGTGWARYECWVTELQWIDSYEFHRREMLTDTWFGQPDRGEHKLGGAFIRTNHLNWEQIEGAVTKRRSGEILSCGEGLWTDVTIPVARVVGNPTGKLFVKATIDDNGTPDDIAKSNSLFGADWKQRQ